jgi:hypothetical protein
MVTRKRLNVMCIRTPSVLYLLVYVFNTYFPFQGLYFVFHSGLYLSLLCSPFSLNWWDDKWNEMRKIDKINLTMSWRHAVGPSPRRIWVVALKLLMVFSGEMIQQPLGERLDGPRNKYGHSSAQTRPPMSPGREASRECGQPPNLGNTQFSWGLNAKLFEYSSSAERNTRDSLPEVCPAASQRICQCIFVNSSIKLLKIETNKINYA